MIQGFIALSRRAVFASIAATLTVAGAASAAEQPVTVFAAASLTDALKAAAATWQSKGHGPVVLSFGSSSAIAKQVEAGAPADIFASADEKWMKYLTDKSLVDTGTVDRPIGNDLVLIGAADSNASIAIAPNFDLAGALNGGRLAIGDPKGVPAGTYAKAALTKLGVWDQVKDKIAQADNVRAALQLVSRGEAPLGIVYATDAKSDPNVKVIDIFPEGTHPPIIYPIAIMASSTNADAPALLAYLKSSATQSVFKDQGFKILLSY